MDKPNAPVTGRSKGGRARADSLTPEERSGIAKRAAVARWTEELPDAICGSPESPLVIGGIPLEAYVLEDGTRVLSQAGFLKALGRHPKANVRREGGEERFPAILQGKSIAPFISDDVLEKSRPIYFRTPSGNKASGYRAELLPVVCEVYLQARDAGELPTNQLHVAKQAEILVRGLAHVGIIALVDEATGYQELRSRNALSRILEAFVAKELQAWVSTFPDDYYRQMFRLRKLEYPRDSVHRPQYFGHLTNDLVYKRLAPGVLDELRKVTERSDSGRPRHKYFQRLTSNLGYPKLREHLGSVVAIMKLSKDWREFTANMDLLHPRYGDTIPLPFEWEDTGEGL
jgi:P63C domain-containing protein